MKFRAITAIATSAFLVLLIVAVWVIQRGEDETAVNAPDAVKEQAVDKNVPDEIVVDESPEEDDVETEVDDGKPDVSKRTPEQQRRYDILAQYLPRYFELAKLIKGIESKRPSFDDAPDGLSDKERLQWYTEKSKPWRENYQEQLQVLRIEKKKLWAVLEEQFPEAAVTVDLGGGHSRFALNLTELRKLVGGPLPTETK